jgi:pyruvate formate lyase activating enzyme
MNKREFIRKGLIGVGGFVSGVYGLQTFGKDISNKSTFQATPLAPGKLDKWSIEARYYSQTARGLKCRLCPTICNLKENEIGECRTRINLDGKLYCFAYGNPCAVHIDPIEKKPLYHFLPSSTAFSIATAGCNLACLNCQNWEISQRSPNETRNYDLMPEKVVEQCKKNNCQSIAYTYSEPIVFYEYTYDTSVLAKKEGIKNILISAGYINEDPLRELCKVIDAANIDLKSFDNKIYEMLNAGTLEPVLNTLKILKEEKIWFEITNLIVPEWTDDLEMIKKMCEWLVENEFQDYPLHFSRFHPTYKLKQLPVTPSATLEKAKQIAIDSGIKFVYIGNAPEIAADNTICPKCGKTIIERRGFTIISNNIIDASCKFCGEKIPGVWN